MVFRKEGMEATVLPKTHILGYLSSNLRDDDRLTLYDVTLQCRDGCVPCHQLVLASLSPMLSSILSSLDTWDTEAITVMLPDVSSGDVRRLLSNLYCDSGQSVSTALISLLGIKHVAKAAAQPKNSENNSNSYQREKLEYCTQNTDGDASDYLDMVWDQEKDINDIKKDSSSSSDEESREERDVHSECTNGLSEEEEEEENIKIKFKNKQPKYEKDDKRISSDEVWQYVTDIDCKPNNYTNGKVTCNLCRKSLRFQGADHHLASLHSILVERSSRAIKTKENSRKGAHWEYYDEDPNNRFRCICRLCGKNLSRVTAAKHVRMKHKVEGGDTILCVHCGKSFRDNHSRKLHELTHTETFQFFCNECGKGFYQKCMLVYHTERVHSENGEKPFQCSDCGKAFKNKQYLYTHIYNNHSESVKAKRQEKKEEKRKTKTYTEEEIAKKPHECNICLKRFSKEDYFKLHMKIHSGESKFVCDVCNKKFTDPYYLKAHVKTVHSDARPYICSICQKSFKYKRVLQTHKCLHESNLGS